MALILDGKKISSEIQEEIKQDIAKFELETGITPNLAAIVVGSKGK